MRWYVVVYIYCLAFKAMAQMIWAGVRAGRIGAGFQMAGLVWSTNRSMHRLAKIAKSFSPGNANGESLKRLAVLYGLELRENETDNELRQRIRELLKTNPLTKAEIKGSKDNATDTNV